MSRDCTPTKQSLRGESRTRLRNVSPGTQEVSLGRSRMAELLHTHARARLCTIAYAHPRVQCIYMRTHRPLDHGVCRDDEGLDTKD